jgi:hypothetical protein
MPLRQRDWIGVRWGLPCSALFHLAIVALVVFVVPEPRKPKALPKEIPVEIVRKAPEKKPAAKPKKQARKTPAKPKQKPPEPKIKQSLLEPKPRPKEPEIKTMLPERKPEPPKAEAKKEPAKPPQVAEKKPEPLLKPKLAEPEPPKRAEKKAAPDAKPAQSPEQKAATAKAPVEKPLVQAKKPPPPPKPPAAVKEPQLALGPKPPVLRPKPAPPPKPKNGSLKVPPQLGGVPLPNAKQRKLLGQWVLTPLTLDTGHRCGKQRVTGTMNLIRRRVRGGGAEIQDLAEIRTTIRWERCRPEGALRKLVLLRRGDRVFLIDAQGVLDHGLMQGNLMVLRDPLGDSYWRRRR